MLNHYYILISHGPRGMPPNPPGSVPRMNRIELQKYLYYNYGYNDYNMPKIDQAQCQVK